MKLIVGVAMGGWAVIWGLALPMTCGSLFWHWGSLCPNDETTFEVVFIGGLAIGLAMLLACMIALRRSRVRHIEGTARPIKATPKGKDVDLI